MNEQNQKSLLVMTEEEVMKFYATVHLKQNSYGAIEFAKATTAHLTRIGAPLNKWRRELKLGGKPVKAVLHNWSFDSARVEQDFEQCLNRNVKYGYGGATTRIIGYDFNTRRVVTESGSVYELAK